MIDPLNFDLSILSSAVKTFGVQAQKVVVIEELSELIKEICKTFRDNGARDNTEKITEEMADVYIMLMQLRIMLEINNDDLQEIINQKEMVIYERINKYLGLK